MYFTVSFDGYIATISMDRSTRFRLDVSATSGLQYKSVLKQMCRRKRVLLSVLIVAIYPSKDTEKYIADDEAIRSSIEKSL